MNIFGVQTRTAPENSFNPPFQSLDSAFVRLD